MRSITEKFFYQYKDVKYKGSTWDEIRRICRVYQEEQTPEKIQQRRDIHNIEEAKRAAERIKKRQQEDRIQEQEQIMRAQEQGMQAQEEMMQEMENRIHQLEQILEMGNAAGVRIPRDERDVIQLPERPPDVPLEVYERLRLDRERADREFNFDPRTVAARFQKDLDMYRRFLYG
jgi:DNA-binding transcriptional MerR regulator